LNLDQRRIDRESRFWQKTAPKYDVWIEKAFKDQYIEIKKKLSTCFSSKDKVLELGTGTGDIAFHIAPYCREVIGVDLAPDMVKIANEKLKSSKISNLSFKNADAYNLQLKDNSFDKVVCCNALQTMKEPKKAIEEGKRVLKKNGEFISITYCFGDSGLWQQVRLFKWVVLYGLPSYWKNFKSKTLINYFTCQGMVVVEQYQIWTKPVILFLRCNK
jgi:ubiquinone/menaquinone biosynthesis C-methylase UbiE